MFSFSHSNRPSQKMWSPVLNVREAHHGTKNTCAATIQIWLQCSAWRNKRARERKILEILISAVRVLSNCQVREKEVSPIPLYPYIKFPIRAPGGSARTAALKRAVMEASAGRCRAPHGNWQTESEKSPLSHFLSICRADSQAPDSKWRVFPLLYHSLAGFIYLSYSLACI